MKKALVGGLAVAAAFGLRQSIRRAGHKMCQRCSELTCGCGHAA